MKPIFVLSLALTTTLPLLGVPRPDLAPNEAPALPKEVVDAADGVGVPELGDPKKRGIGFLGVAAMGVPLALADQLKIDHGVTLSRVVPDSPAAKAGLEVSDIILEVGEKKVTNMMDLSDSIKAHREGDKVTLKVIQKGKRIEKKVTLAAAPPLPPGFGPGGMGMRILPGGGAFLPGGGLQMGWGGGGGFRMGDEEGSVEIKGSGEGREVIVRDQDGEILYEGPWVSPQDRAAPRPDLRKRIERVAGMFGGEILPFRNFNVPVPEILPLPVPPPQVLPLVPPLLPGGPEDDGPEEAPEEDEDR